MKHWLIEELCSRLRDHPGFRSGHFVREYQALLLWRRLLKVGFDSAELALAAYAPLSEGSPNTDSKRFPAVGFGRGMGSVRLRNLPLRGFGQSSPATQTPRPQEISCSPYNTERLKKAGLSDKQADLFVEKYPAVVTQFNDTVAEGGLGTSFSITVFKDASGQLTQTFCGTAELFGSPNDLITDANIATAGAAYDQIVALYNWWMRETAPVGTPVSQFRLVQESTHPQVVLLNGKHLEPAGTAAATGRLGAAIAADADHRLGLTGHPIPHSVASDLRAYLAGKGYGSEQLARLDAFISASDPANPSPMAADMLAAFLRSPPNAVIHDPGGRDDAEDHALCQERRVA